MLRKGHLLIVLALCAVGFVLVSMRSVDKDGASQGLGGSDGLTMKQLEAVQKAMLDSERVLNSVDALNAPNQGPPMPSRHTSSLRADGVNPGGDAELNRLLAAVNARVGDLQARAAESRNSPASVFDAPVGHDEDPYAQLHPAPAPAPAPVPAPATSSIIQSSAQQHATSAADLSTERLSFDGLKEVAGKTTFKCFTSSDWAQVCVYSNLCYDGEKIVFFDDSKPDFQEMKRHHRVGDNNVGHHTFDVYPRPPPTTEGLPLNTRTKGYYRSQAVLTGKTSTKVSWTSDAMWIIEPEYRGYEIAHPFFWTHSVMGIWEARFSNDSWGGMMPALDRLYLPKNKGVDFNQWNKNTLEVLIQPHTKVIHDVSQLSKDNLVCSKRAVVTGKKPNVFSGLAPCYLFRDAIYQKVGATGADRVKKEVYPPAHLVIWSRKGRRGFENLDEIIKLVEDYGIDYELVHNHGSFEEQVKLMSRAGVLLLSHGAAATNTMFQPHRSVLIEVFPYMRKRFGFTNVAQACGMYYYPIFSWKKPVGNPRMSQPLFSWKCDHLASIDTNHEGECDQAQKDSNIQVPIDVLEQTLIDAFDTIGKRIYRGVPSPRPTRPPGAKPETNPKIN